MIISITNTNTDLTLIHYIRLIIAFSITLVLLSLYQYTVLYAKGVVDSIISVSFLLSITHHIGFGALAGLLFVAPFHFLEKSKYFRGFRFTFFMLIFFLIIEIMLIGYYTTTFVPLGADLLGYSIEDIKTTVFNSGGVSFLLIFVILIVCALFYFIYRLTAKYYHFVNRMFPFTFILFTIFVATLFMEGLPINQNKTQYLAVNLYIGSLEDNSYIEEGNNVEYPLLRNNDTKNVLGNFFNFKDEKPNIVFILVEGLGRDFVGEGAEFKGFTPFLDSLTKKSLYWENCFSNTGRTFGVLPSLIGSLPFGKKGFMELKNSPNRLTLYSILKQNNYSTSFQQGSNISFDNVDNFLLEEDVDFILDRSNFGGNYKLSPSDASGSSWGYPDKELFKKSLSLKREKGKPKLDVFMTISSHEPFIPPQQEYFKDRVTKLLKKSNLSNKAKRIVKKNENVFASLLYTDDAIKWFIESYSRRREFKNTIFIITGDHRLVPIPMRNQLARFHVPLLIYSPLLKKTKKMSAINSHFDVTPSLLSMLDAKYNLNIPKQVAWMGAELDMNTNFRGTKNIPLMRNKNEIKEYISNTELYSDGNVYKINSKIDLTATSNLNIEKLLDDYKSMNAYVTANNKIIPDSLVVFKVKKAVFSEEEMVWINSVLNGQGFDSAYKTARNFAFNDEKENALLLCKYILSEIPGHIDVKILTGRINAWNGNYEEAISIFHDCIALNPTYSDTYAALLDVYYWSDQSNKALLLESTIKENNIKDADIEEKIERAYTEIAKNELQSNKQ